MARMTIVHFKDSGEVLKGFVDEYDPSRGGFFILPRDALSKSEKVWINLDDASGVFFVKDWNDPAPVPADESCGREPEETLGDASPEVETLSCAPLGEFDPSAYRILVVDDEENIVKLIEVNLAKRGFKVLKAFDGEEAIKLIKEESPDLVVCDIMMPNVDGYGVLKALRTAPETQKIPFIALTAKTQYKDVFEGWQKGVDSYVTKPFRPEALIDEIRNLLTPS